LIKNLWELKDYGARQLIREFLDKDWKREMKNIVENFARNWFA